MISLGGYLQVKFACIKKKALTNKEIEIFDLCEVDKKELLTKYLCHTVTQKQVSEALEYFEAKRKSEYSSRLRLFLRKNGVCTGNTADSTYIYLIGNRDGLVKIGKSKHPEKRVRELSTGSGTELICIAYWRVNADSSVIEKEMHKYFREYHTKGEWFSFHNMSIEDIELSISSGFERVYHNRFIQTIGEVEKAVESFIEIVHETQKGIRFRSKKGFWWCPKSSVVAINKDTGLVHMNHAFKPEFNKNNYIPKKRFWRS